MKQKHEEIVGSGGVIFDIAGAAERANQQIKEEETALFELVKKTGPLTFTIPENLRWTYEYRSRSTQKEGVATARFVEVALSKSCFDLASKVLLITFGPKLDFTQNACDYNFLRKQMGGLAAVLAGIRAAQVRAAKKFDEGRAQSLAEITASDRS